MDGRPKEIFSDTDKLESVGLSAPQITLLMKKLKKIIPRNKRQNIYCG